MKKILFLIVLVLISFIAINQKTYALNRIQPDGLTFEWYDPLDDWYQDSRLWTDTEEGYLILDYDGAGDISNGLMLEDLLRFSSVSTRYTIIRFYTPHGSVEFDMSGSGSYELSFIATSGVNWYYDVTFNSSLYTNYQYELILNEGSYIYLLDNDYIVDSYNNGFNAGYADGLIDGFDNAQELYGYYNGTSWLGYYDGITQGVIDGSEGAVSLLSFVPSILGVVFGFFFQLASIEFLGISILEVIAAFMSVVVVLLIIKVYGGSK